MSIFYYKTKVGNIGDDLNAWLWPQLINQQVTDNYPFVGIGSILTKSMENDFQATPGKRIIPLGTGIRGFDSLPHTSIDFNNGFFRGPISSLAMTGTLEHYITDGAYALRQLKDFDKYLSIDKKYEVSFMPYLRTSGLLPWKKICDKLGVHYISPHPEEGIESTLKEIAASKHIITEAMHGAILADIFRVPFQRVMFAAHHFEGSSVAALKWNDWCRSVEMTIQDNLIASIPFKMTITPRLLKAYIKWNKSKLTTKAETTLGQLMSKTASFQLSKDAVLTSIDQKIKQKLEAINKMNG